MKFAATTVTFCLSTLVILSSCAPEDYFLYILKVPAKSTQLETKDGTSTCSAPISSCRPGRCPAPDPGLRCITCNDNCTSDTECGGFQKCCPQPGCGNMCKCPQVQFYYYVCGNQQ